MANEGEWGRKRVAKCRSSTPVRNKEQKIDRLLSFMFLLGQRERQREGERERGSTNGAARPSIRLLFPTSTTSSSRSLSSSCCSFSSFSLLLAPCHSYRRRVFSLSLSLSSRRTIRRIAEILHGALWEKNQGAHRKTQRSLRREGAEKKVGAAPTGRVER